MIGSMHASRNRRSLSARRDALCPAQGARARIGFLLAFALSVLGGVLASEVSAQDDNASDWGGGPPDSTSQCTPKCRRGYECKHGECLPICSPVCGPGFLCTAGGTCVRTEAPPPVQPSSNSGWGAGGSQCLPSCRTGYLCISGQCVSSCNPICGAGEMCTERGECVPEGSEPSPKDPKKKTEDSDEKDAPEEEERSSSADSNVNLHADVLGLLQFGLTPTLEVGGKHVAGYVRVRPLNTGLLSYFLLDHKKDDTFKWGIGGALGLHLFTAGAGNMRGLFGGVALEYAFGKNENNTTRADYKTGVLIPQLDIGYRWGFGHLLLGVGARLGVLLPVDKRDQAHAVGIPASKSNGCVGADACDKERSILPIGNIFLDLGYFF